MVEFKTELREGFFWNDRVIDIPMTKQEAELIERSLEEDNTLNYVSIEQIPGTDNYRIVTEERFFSENEKKFEKVFSDRGFISIEPTPEQAQVATQEPTQPAPAAKTEQVAETPTVAAKTDAGGNLNGFVESEEASTKSKTDPNDLQEAFQKDGFIGFIMALIAAIFTSGTENEKSSIALDDKYVAALNKVNEEIAKLPESVPQTAKDEIENYVKTFGKLARGEELAPDEKAMIQDKEIVGRIKQGYPAVSDAIEQYTLAGLKNAIAQSGTTITPEQEALLKKFEMIAETKAWAAQDVTALTPAQIAESLDLNNDNKVDKEVAKNIKEYIDLNSDGKVSKEEAQAVSDAIQNEGLKADFAAILKSSSINLSWNESNHGKNSEVTGTDPQVQAGGTKPVEERGR